MKKLFFGCFMVFVLLLNGCATSSTAIVTEAPASVEPAWKNTPLPATPLESAFAPENPTVAPPEEVLEPQSVTFETPDGARIEGELYGSGKTAVVFSVMGSCSPAWGELARQTAARQLMALTYQWRDCGPAGPLSEDRLVENFVNDARGAIDFVKDRGAENVILAGASLGGIASAKLAIESDASGLIVLASPPKIPNHDFMIEAADLDTEIPKLFLTAENDSVVQASASRELYEMAAEPKEWQIYPGTAHGTDLFKTENGEEVQDRILAFILETAATP